MDGPAPLRRFFLFYSVLFLSLDVTSIHSIDRSYILKILSLDSEKQTLYLTKLKAVQSLCKAVCFKIIREIFYRGRININRGSIYFCSYHSEETAVWQGAVNHEKFQLRRVILWKR